MDDIPDAPPAMKAFGLLEVIASMDHAPTLAELTEVADLPKPTLHRWLAMLENADLIHRLPDGRRYELAARATTLAFSILANSPGSMRRHQILQKVAADLGESCNFTVLQGYEVIYLDRVEAALPLRVAFQKGSHVPAHCSASGKLFLAMMSPAKRERLLRATGLKRYTPNTLTDLAALDEEFAKVKRQGYALDDEEFLSGLFCIAVPIFDLARGECVAALALQAPIVRLSRANADARLPALRSAAEALATTLT
ncbi:IclR family transcriptional regulator [Xanthobacter sp. KR7-225]|uniref:IclR family transcriptional regulator n=1 Tax=Xanthobacter sp. KR7-225 TaxID=3156613 RepID=UPI0032B4F9D6